MLHQPAKHYSLIEIEKQAVEAVFYFLKEKKYKVFIEPSAEVFEHYVAFEPEAWIVKSLVTEAPVQEVEKVPTVTIEKMLVDLYSDPISFEAQQGSELDFIFQQAIDNYSLSESRLLRYASRRRKKKELDAILDRVSKFRS